MGGTTFPYVGEHTNPFKQTIPNKTRRWALVFVFFFGEEQNMIIFQVLCSLPSLWNTNSESVVDVFPVCRMLYLLHEDAHV